MKKYESGRSMVEMLGVLAIIGVLSVGGIAGYTMAMNKYKANEIMAAASQCAILARSANGGTGITGTKKCAADLGVTAPSGINTPDTNFTATYDSSTDVVTIKAVPAASAVATALGNIGTQSNFTLETS